MMFLSSRRAIWILLVLTATFLTADASLVPASAAQVAGKGATGLRTYDGSTERSHVVPALDSVPTGGSDESSALIGDLSRSLINFIAAETASTAVPSVADVSALVPKGSNLNSWGGQIWGTGTQGAQDLIGARSATELQRIPGLNVGSATTLRDFYAQAAAAGKGGTTAPVRVQLLNNIISTLGGTP